MSQLVWQVWQCLVEHRVAWCSVVQLSGRTEDRGAGLNSCFLLSSQPNSGQTFHRGLAADGARQTGGKWSHKGCLLFLEVTCDL